jgi:hypothetical protein
MCLSSEMTGAILCGKITPEFAPLGSEPRPWWETLFGLRLVVTENFFEGRDGY